MKLLVVLAVPVLALAATLASSSSWSQPQVAAPAPGSFALAGCTCSPPTYVRSSSSIALSGGEDFVELDTDAGLPVTVTMPATPTKLEPVEVWLGAQPGLPGGTVTIDTAGEAYAGADLLLDEANEGRRLVWIRPTPSGGGYWRVTRL
jgi:hypothetical protein